MKSILKCMAVLSFAQIGCAASLEPEGEPSVLARNINGDTVDVLDEFRELLHTDKETMKALKS